MYLASKEAFRKALSALDDIKTHRDEFWPLEVGSALGVGLGGAVEMFGGDPETYWEIAPILTKLREEYRAMFPEDFEKPLIPPVKLLTGSPTFSRDCETLAGWVEGLVLIDRFSLKEYSEICDATSGEALAHYLCSRSDDSEPYITRLELFLVLNEGINSGGL
jgi:hypothetical protein